METDGTWEGNDHMSEFLKTGHTLDTFHNLGKNFSFNQRLNNFAKIADIFRLIFLMSTTGILSGSLDFLEPRPLI